MSNLKEKAIIGGVMVGGILLLFLIFFAILAIESYLVMIIWNNVIIKKFPGANIEELSFWDALGLIVIISILFPGNIVYANKITQNLNTK